MKFAYDPSGLRTAKAASFAAVDAVIDKVKPTHLDRPAWFGKEDEIIAACAKKGIPVTPGQRFKFNVPPNYNKVAW